MPKRLGPLQKFRMKAWLLSFYTICIRRLPWGSLRCFTLGPCRLRNAISLCPGIFSKKHVVYNFPSRPYLKASGKMCTLTVRLKIFCLQVSFYLEYGVFKMTETVLFPGKAAVRIFPLLRRIPANLLRIAACMSAGLLVRYIRLVILIHGANVCLVQVFVFPSIFTEENFANDKEPGQRLLRKDRGGQFLLPKDHQGDGLYEI